MNIVCSGCNFSNPYLCFSRFVGYYNVNVKLAGTGSLYTDKSRIMKYKTAVSYTHLTLPTTSRV